MSKRLLPVVFLLSSACTIGGVVDSETGSPISGVTVTYEQLDTSGAVIGAWSTMTNAGGEYAFNPYGNGGTTITDPSQRLPENETFQITVSRAGYRTATYYRFLGDYTNVAPSGQLYRDPEIFTLVPNGATDNDGDGLSASWEASLGTSDAYDDSDFDGLTDYEETHGAMMLDTRYWIDGVAADPAVHDVYVKIFARPDALDDSNTSGATAASIDTFMANFGAAVAVAPPIENNGVQYPRRLHIAKEMTSSIPAVVDFWLADGNGGTTVTCDANDNCTIDGTSVTFVGQDYDTLKPALFPRRVPNQSAEWRITRIGVVTKQYVDWSNKRLSLSSGIGEILGNDFIVTLSRATFGSSATDENLRGTIWHELGHTFGLLHQDNDHSTGLSNSRVHKSVMNYRYQTTGGGEGPPGLPSGVPSWSLGGGKGDLTSGCGGNATLMQVGHSSMPRCVKNNLYPRTVSVGGGRSFASWCLQTTNYGNSQKELFWAGGSCTQWQDCVVNRPRSSQKVYGICGGQCYYSVEDLGEIRSWYSTDSAAVNRINNQTTSATSLYDFRRADCDYDEWDHAGLWADFTLLGSGGPNANAADGRVREERAARRRAAASVRSFRAITFEAREQHSRGLRDRIIGPDLRIAVR